MSDEIRNKFIAWCKTRNVNPQKLKGTDQFIGAEVQSAWMGWQAALSQQPAQPTVRESLTVQAQPICEPVIHITEDGYNFISNQKILVGIRGLTFMRGNPYNNFNIPLYASLPDYEALRAENAQLKETESMLRGLIGEAEEMLIRVISERDAAKEREQWIHDNATTSGGGHGFTVTFFVPVDHEDIFCGISEAIKLEQK